MEDERQMHDGHSRITKSHPEHSSAELKITLKVKYQYHFFWTYYGKWSIIFFYASCIFSSTLSTLSNSFEYLVVLLVFLLQTYEPVFCYILGILQCLHSPDPDRRLPTGALWSGTTLFENLLVYVKQVQYWSLLNWRKMWFHCGFVAVPVNWNFAVISPCFAIFLTRLQTMCNVLKYCKTWWNND